MAFLKKYNLPRILLIAVIIVSFVAFSSYTAPKARAEAFTLTSLFLMLVMSVMASLGVTLAATALEQGINYLQDKYVSFVSTKGFSSLTDYLSSLGVTAISQLCKPIFGALSIGKVVYDGIAEFCTWLFAEDDVVSGGDPVGQVGVSGYYSSAVLYLGWTSTEYNYLVKSDWLSYSKVGTTYTITVTANTLPTFRPAVVVFRIPNPRPSSVSVLCTSGSGSYATAFVGTSNVSQYVSNSNYSNSTLTYNSYNINYNTWQSLSIPYIGSATFLLVGLQNVTNGYKLAISFDENDPTTPPGFIITPSATVLAPPSVSTGQTYNVSVTGVNSDTSVENAISTAVAPLTSTGGLTTSAAPAGTAVPSEWAWLYDGLEGINSGVESIKNNTSDDKHGTDFIPSSTTMDFGFWHYVPDWISSVGAGFSMLVGVVTSLPPIMLAPLYGILVLGIVVALFHKLWGS